MHRTLAYFLGGVAFSLSTASPVEWNIHKHLLHATPKQRKRMSFINKASIGHNDNHHGAYKGPAHYYRDITNENETIHFSRGDVGLIAGSAAVAGLAINRGYSELAAAFKFSNNPGFGVEDAAFIAGTVGGTMVYYGAYEFTHHYMHVIGKRRLSINRTLGDIIQDGDRDGNLRFSKPLLDDICNHVESEVDENLGKDTCEFYFNPYLLHKLDEQIKVNRSYDFNGTSARAKVTVNHTSEETLNKLTNKMIHEEGKIRSGLNPLDKIKYFIDMKIQKHLRQSSLFSYLDNHHFIHHYRYGSNLNVVCPMMDKVMGTKQDSTLNELEKNMCYWLCPNSPDIEPFSLVKKDISP